MSERGAPGADEPDAPGTEDEPIPPGMEEAEVGETAVVSVSTAAPQEAVAPDGATVAAPAEASVDGATAYPYYSQAQTAAAYPGYGDQYAGYDQYYGYWPGYGDASGASSRPTHCFILQGDHRRLHSEVDVGWKSQTKTGWVLCIRSC